MYHGGEWTESLVVLISAGRDMIWSSVFELWKCLQVCDGEDVWRPKLLPFLVA